LFAVKPNGASIPFASMARKLAFLLLAVVVPPAITLAWLGLLCS
jgi:hypothetical protein